MNLNEYLSENRASLDSTATSLMEALATEDDTDRDRRNIARNVSKALKAALASLFKKGFREGECWGAHGDITVMIYQPAPGMDLFGKFNLRAGRLSEGGMVPCPVDWPRSGMSLNPFIESMFEAISEAGKTSRVITISDNGEGNLGSGFAGREFFVEELAGGELHWKPL
jgi:hypothetical protein